MSTNKQQQQQQQQQLRIVEIADEVCPPEPRGCVLDRRGSVQNMRRHRRQTSNRFSAQNQVAAGQVFSRVRLWTL
ncbi:hypothetical protein ACLKA7_001085 [Drosophila subpalustris]